MPESRATSNERPVALLAEGVDRNFWGGAFLSAVETVALLAEGGDSNTQRKAAIRRAARSPSSRRAGIEIWMLAGCWVMLSVALLAEGAGRNRHKNMVNSYYRKARN